MAVRRGQKLKPGDMAPDFRLQRLDGEDDALLDVLARGPVLLAFFKVSCPVCQLTFPFLERIHAGGTLPIYGVSQNDSADTRDFTRRFGVGFPILLDPEGAFPVSNLYGISTVPTLFLIEKDGTTARVIEGWNRGEVQAIGRLAGVDPFREGEYVPEAKAG